MSIEIASNQAFRYVFTKYRYSHPPEGVTWRVDMSITKHPGKWTQDEAREAATKDIDRFLDAPNQDDRNDVMASINGKASLNQIYRTEFTSRAPEIVKEVNTWLKSKDAADRSKQNEKETRKSNEYSTMKYDEIARRMSEVEFNAVRKDLGPDSLLYPACNNKPYKMAVGLVTDDYIVQSRLIPPSGGKPAHVVGVFHERKMLPDGGKEIVDAFFSGSLKKQLVEIAYKDGQASVKGPTQFIPVETSIDFLNKEMQSLREIIPKAHHPKLDAFLESLSEKLGNPAARKQAQAPAKPSVGNSDRAQRQTPKI
jgi:hypothetical protein